VLLSAFAIDLPPQPTILPQPRYNCNSWTTGSMTRPTSLAQLPMSSRLDQDVGMTTSGHGAADAVSRENLAASAMRCAHTPTCETAIRHDEGSPPPTGFTRKRVGTVAAQPT